MSTEPGAAPAVSPSIQLMQLLWPGAMAAQAVHVAAKLGLADLVAKGPKSLDELAGATQTHAPSLLRFLRAVTTLGLFSEDGAGRFSQTPLSDVLRSDHPESVRPWALMLGAGFIWRPIGELAASLATGEPAFERIFGAQFFKYLADHGEDATVFNAAMSSSPAWVAAVVNGYEFSKFDRIVDVGGGRGALLTAILTANPRLHGVLFDLPGVVDTVPAEVRQSLGGRLDVQAGNFFGAVPAGADAYLLSGVIHDWHDEAATSILKNVRRAVRPDGRLLILDAVLGGTNEPAQAMMDLLMMELTGGRERTESQFRSLLGGTGFSLESITPLHGASLLEGRPI